MSTIESKWALHNPLKSWTLYNLNEVELSAILLSVSAMELRIIKISKKNESSWVSLDQNTYPAFFKKGSKDQYSSNSGYPEVATKTEDVTETGYFVIKPDKIRQTRLHKRHEISVSCTLVGSNNQEFKTSTVDISEGGLHFKEFIPAWVAGYFLVDVNEKFKLMCSLVEDQKEKRRVQIVSEDSDFNYTEYKNWLGTLK